MIDGPVRGRGAGVNPANRFEKLSLEVVDEHRELLERETEVLANGRRVTTEVFRDASKSVLNKIQSPDMPLGWSINPYRGCEHGCVYCYARPGHEYFGLSCGLDFETKIFAKPDAAQLLQKELNKPKWKGEPIMMSGVTDCYQPIEAKMGITRQCLKVMCDYRQPVTIVTKNRLILRDLDLLREMARHGVVHVAVTVTTLDNKLASTLEPRAASPRDRLWTIQRLASAGVPVMAMVAPIIPAVNDREIPAILEKVANAGATTAAYVLLRLPWQVKELMDDWLHRHMPDRREHVMSLLKQSYHGKVYDAQWFLRGRGEGAYAQQLAQTFRVFSRRYGLDGGTGGFNRAAFRRPADHCQMSLFQEDNANEQIVNHTK